ncbi:MAG: DUF937 domain-containing protein [Acidobacteriota bacterium]
MSVLELLSQQLDSNAISEMSRQIGADEKTTQNAVNAALPMLVGALANNTQQAGGAQALLGALDRDHDGSVLDDVMGFLGGAGGQGGQGGGMGGAILGHILGGRQAGAEQAIGRASGLNAASVGPLLSMLAPLVMGALSKQKQQGGLGADGLASMLGQERQQVERAAPGAGSLLSSVLDSDGDGEIGDDLAKIGSNLLGSFLSGRR